MATFTDNWTAHVIAFDYGFYPVDIGKYEPSDNVFDNRWYRLARQFDGTNALILFNPLALYPTGTWDIQIPYHVSNGLDPNSAGDYHFEPDFKYRLTYVGPDREFFIWWDLIDSWIINDQIGHTDGPYWKRTDPYIVGAYAPLNGAIGVATVAAGPG